MQTELGVKKCPASKIMKGIAAFKENIDAPSKGITFCLHSLQIVAHDELASSELIWSHEG